MQYMVIERFKPGRIREVYRRFDETGRMMPAGLVYVNSWIDLDLSTCYQVVETNDPMTIREWIDNWKDLVDFEVIPVQNSAQARNAVMQQ